MNSQYLQWVTGPNRGSVESVELMQDGQTFQDVAILSNGRKVPMTKVGVDFIILPSSTAPLSQVDLDVMYPKAVQKQNRKRERQEPEQIPVADHASIMGFDVSDVPKEKEAPPKKQKNNTFASDLLTRAKKADADLEIHVELPMPTSAFFAMINDTFDESTVNEVIDLMLDSIDRELLRKSMKESIINFYGGNK